MNKKELEELRQEDKDLVITEKKTKKQTKHTDKPESTNNGKKKAFAFSALGVGALGLALGLGLGLGLPKDTTPKSYSFDVTTTDQVVSIGNGSYKKGSKISIEAQPIEDYIFDHWELNGEEVSKANPYDFTLSDETTGDYTAVYLAPTLDKLSFILNADGETYSVKALNRDIEGSVVIPSTYEGKSVTNIGYNAFFSCGGLTSITIPDSVTSIDYKAFYSCTGLTSVTIPDSVTILGKSAFERCSNLASVTIGNSVTSIGYEAFNDCNSLTSVTIGKSVISIDVGAFSYCYKLVEVYNLSSLTITKGSEDNGYVGYYALNIYTPTSGESKLKQNGDYLMYEDSINNQYYLLGYTGTETELTLPTTEYTYEIWQYAFYENNTITKVTIPDCVTSIEGGAFLDCYKLVEVYNLSSLNITKGSYGNGGIGHDALNIYTPTSGESKLKQNGDYLMYEDSENDEYYLLGYTGTETELTLPKTEYNYEIYQCAFYKNNAITKVTIPSSVISIGDSAFNYCSSLTSVTIPNSVTSILYSSFNYCSSLTSVTIPSSVTSINWGAFSNCSSLTSVTIESTYAYVKATSTSGCGELLQYATSVRVLKTIVDDTSNTNSYLNDTSKFTKTEDGDYYLYTKI